jgi:septum formation protein
MHILLGSKSPRRQQILEGMGYSFTTLHQDVEEIYPENLDLREIPVFLANKKADALKHLITTKDEVLLTCDTIVICDNLCLEKPKDELDAKNMLMHLSGKTHSVISAVHLYGLKAEFSFSEETLVHFVEMHEDEINFYIEKYKPFDKAGSYAIQEWIGLNKISKIEGSFYNVMGLPAHSVYKYLETYKNL